MYYYSSFCSSRNTQLTLPLRLGYRRQDDGGDGGGGTVGGQDDGDILLAEGADAQQHGRPLGGEEAEGHVLPGPAALPGHAGGLRAPVLHDREGLLEGEGDRGLAVKGHRHLWKTKTQGEGEEEEKGILLNVFKEEDS